MKTCKVALFTPYLSPYRIALFNYIKSKTKFNFKVFCLTEMGENRQWKIYEEDIKFNYFILPGFHKFVWKYEIPIYINPTIFSFLLRYKPDIVITSGYDALAYWVAFIYAKIFKKKYILWNESTLLSSRIMGGFGGLIKKFLIKNADAYISGGIKAREYLEYFGANKDKISISISTVDMDFFKKKVEEYRKNKTFLSERKKYPEFLLLYVGQLIERKGVIKVLEALNKLQDSSIGLFIVGDGPLKDSLKKYCDDNHLQNVFFEGFKNKEELCRYYALSDVLILPSFREVWGLVVNEALASGLYVLASKYVGASFDLIKEGWNGSIFDPYNVEEIATVIQWAKNNVEDIRSKRNEISTYACQEFSIEKAGNSFLKAIEKLI